MTARFFIMTSLVFCQWSFFLAHNVFAKVKEPQPAQSDMIKPREKKATLSFEDELVEGTTQKPELYYLFQKKNFNYKRLIRLRENFLPEMRKTSEELQRARGGI